MLSTVLDWLKAQRRQIWKYFWQNTPPVNKANWSHGINRISQFIREPCTYAPCPKANQKSPALCGTQSPSCCGFGWMPPRCRSSRAWLYLVLVEGAFSGGQVCPPRCNSLSNPSHVAYSMRTTCPKQATPNCGHHSHGPLACGLYQHRENHGAELTA